LPDPYQAASFQGQPFVVLTPETVPLNEEYEPEREQIFEGINWVYFGITPENYEVLSRNQAEALRWVKEAMWRLQYYAKEDVFDK